MGRRCCVKGCANSIGKPITTVYRFPKNKIQREAWMDSIRNTVNKDVNLEYFGVCGEHFNTEDFLEPNIKSPRGKSKLSDWAIPSPTPCSRKKTVQVLECQVRDAKKKIRDKVKCINQKDKIIEELRNQILKLNTDIQNYKIDVELERGVRRIFSPKQIQQLKNPDTFVHWDESDISKAIALDSVSSKCYNYLRDVLSFPMPSRSTIKRWITEIRILPGILTPVLNILATSLQYSTPMARVATLAFDEMSIDDRFCYDEKEDMVYGGADQMLGTFVRGTFADWMQIVHYGFNEKPKKDKLFEIIENVERTGIEVAAIVSDMGTKNQGLWKELNIGKSFNGEIYKTSFPNPADTTRNVWVFPDFPHLLKLLRNHLIDSSFTLPDGTVIDKTLIENLLNVQKHDLKLTYKVTQKHISVRGKERMKVRPAFELFSAKVANAISLAFPKKKSESEFFRLINNFSDLMNTRTTKQPFSTIYKSAYGSCYQDQQKFLGTFYSYFSRIRVGKRNPGTYAPFQRGILISIRSLIGLFEDMVVRVSAKYLMTSRVNQDFVENSFGIVRGSGGFNMTPNAVDAKNRVRRLVMGQRFNKSVGTNTTSCDDQDLSSSGWLKSLISVDHGPRFPFRTPIVTENMLDDISLIDPKVDCLENSVHNMTIYEKCEEGGREYVAGFIAKKLHEKYPDLKRKPSDHTEQNGLWIRLLTEGGLTEPSTMWLSYFKKFDEYFEVFHPGGKISKEFDVVKRFSSFLQTNYPAVPEKVIKLYAKTRTMIRIAAVNKAEESKKFIWREKLRKISSGKSQVCVHGEIDMELTENEEVQDKESEAQLEELLEILETTEIN